MNISARETTTMALNSIWTNKFRSFLTILGIVIGIMTVVTVSSLLTGLRKQIVVFFEEFGPDNVFISKVSGDPNSGGNRRERLRKDLDPDYADLLKRLCPSVARTGVSVFVPGFIGGSPLTARSPGGPENDRVRVVGVTYDGTQIAPRELAKGRTFTSEEAARGAKVGMIGALLEEALFPDGESLGKPVIIGGAEYTVIGVYAKAKGGFFGENGLDLQVDLPFKTVMGRYPQLRNFFITAQALPGQRTIALEELEQALRRIRRVPAGVENDFNISTADSIIRNFDRITGMIVLVSIALSAVGLLVGGIGVMNIMLVSVTERTKEIGVRKALGARRPDIVLQFLLEAITLTGVGGALGIVLSILVTLLIGALVPALPSEVPPWAVATGFGVSVAVGVFFGTWPAMKAARLDPVEALRYE